MRKFGKVVLWILLGVVGLVVLGLVYLFITFPPPGYVIRVLRSAIPGQGDAWVYDFTWHDSRPMDASLSPFYFNEAPADEMVRSVFEQHPDIDDLDSFLEQTRTQAFIVIQDDNILYENYFNGGSRDKMVTSFSVAKSFTSALIGAAIADGYIQSVDDPITDYLPEFAERDPAFAEITIRDLLEMSSGIQYQETDWLDGDNALTYHYPDLRKLAIEETKVIDPPGSYWLYNNYHPLLLGMILERATGMPVATYLETRIWQPIGMEFDGSWSMDSSGFEKMESGVNARAIDFAKFGRLYLNNGQWDGIQVLPAEWVEASTRSVSSRDKGTYYPDHMRIFTDNDAWYGFMWMGIPHDEANYDYRAAGNHGQYIYVSPMANLIIIRNGESFGNVDWDHIFFNFASSIVSEDAN